MSDVTDYAKIIRSIRKNVQPKGSWARGKLDVAAEEAADALEAVLERVAKLEDALEPFCFFLGEARTTQDAWETVYRDRLEDWVDYHEIEAARAALAKR